MIRPGLQHAHPEDGKVFQRFPLAASRVKLGGREAKVQKDGAVGANATKYIATTEMLVWSFDSAQKVYIFLPCFGIVAHGILQVLQRVRIRDGKLEVRNE
uniref:(northern house mosquito) hypothetical protein n=1 Tax=Culex pipiens TaxID=7175 RepID=A0A8D8C4I7_CULPI